MITSSRLFAIAVVTLLGASFAQTSAAATYKYTARTADAVRTSGDVRVGSLVWKCSGKACTIAGPWPDPAVGACAELAKKVGRIISCGHPAQQLNQPQLAQFAPSGVLFQLHPA